MPTPAKQLLEEGCALQLEGRLRDAAERFATAVDAASAAGDSAVQAESLRRLGVVHHLCGEGEAAVDYCRRSREVALTLPRAILAAEAAMALGNLAQEQGRIDEASAWYQEALEHSTDDIDIAAKLEQNLASLDSLAGKPDGALAHSFRALAAYESAGRVLGCAMAHHNIATIYASQRRWHEAHHACERAAQLAVEGCDSHLAGLCLLSHAEIDLAHERYDEVRKRAEAALAIFDRLGARLDMADAYRLLGTALRFMNMPAVGESRLRSALEIATGSGSPLIEAETSRDLAALYADTRRPEEALRFLDRALALFERLGARRDVDELNQRRAALVVGANP
jgi:tetratricopeptide (TPR) repeat protein